MPTYLVIEFPDPAPNPNGCRVLCEAGCIADLVTAIEDAGRAELLARRGMVEFRRGLGAAARAAGLSWTDPDNVEE